MRDFGSFFVLYFRIRSRRRKASQFAQNGVSRRLKKALFEKSFRLTIGCVPSQSNDDDSLPRIRRVRPTQLLAWPVILSLLLDIGDSDVVVSVAGLAGLHVDWKLSPKDNYSHSTRIRAYRPKIEAAYQKLESRDQETVLSIVAAELARRYPQKAESIRATFARIGWTIKTTPETVTGENRESFIMKRDKELQRLLLTQVRDGKAPPELSKYSEAEQVYNAALLINAGLVDGQAIQGSTGHYVSAVMTELTSAGHDFIEKQVNVEESLRTSFPPELAVSLHQFKKDHPGRSTFVMMRFGKTSAHIDILKSIRDSLETHGIKALRADDKDFHEDIFWNILTYVYGCDLGIAVFERIEQEEFNPNIAFEVGYMMALKKPVLLLKDSTLKYLNVDLIGKLYKEFDPQNIFSTVAPQLQRWLKDRNIIL